MFFFVCLYANKKHNRYSFAGQPKLQEIPVFFFSFLVVANIVLEQQRQRKQQQQRSRQ